MGAIKKLKQLLKIVDFNSLYFRLYMNQNDRNQSTFGGFSTIVLLLLLILAIISLGNDFFKRLNPTFLIQDIVPSNYSIYNITNNNFTLAFRVEDVYGQLVDPNNTQIYFEINYDKLSTINNSLTLISSELLPYKICDIDDFEDKEYFNSSGFKNMFCIDYSYFPNKQLSFGGDWGGDFLNYLYIISYTCPDGEQNNRGFNCTNKDTIYSLINEQSLYMSVYVSEAVINPSNYSNVISKKLMNIFQVVDLHLIKAFYMRFTDYQVNLDIGWLIEDSITFQMLGYSSFWSDFSFIESVDTKKEFLLQNSNLLWKKQ